MISEKKGEQLGRLTCYRHGTCFNRQRVKMRLLYLKVGVMDAREQKTPCIVNGRKEREQLGRLICNRHGTCFNRLQCVKKFIKYFTVPTPSRVTQSRPISMASLHCSACVFTLLQHAKHSDDLTFVYLNEDYCSCSLAILDQHSLHCTF